DQERRHEERGGGGAGTNGTLRSSSLSSLASPPRSLLHRHSPLGYIGVHMSQPSIREPQQVPLSQPAQQMADAALLSYAPGDLYSLCLLHVEKDFPFHRTNTLIL